MTIIPGVLVFLVLVAFVLTILAMLTPPKVRVEIPLLVVCLVLLLLAWPK